VGITEPSAPAFSRQPARAVRSQVLQKFARGTLKDLRAHWHSHDLVFAIPTRTIRSFAMPATIGNMLRVVAQMKQGVKRRVRNDPNISAAPAVAARRTTARHKLLSTKGRYAIAPMAASYMNLDPINKHSINI
jgi:hypothetical protein